ncbi:type II secretion system F family protein [Marimonas sp. MJW-29]|uniref:Type II secretion system F family protein n=1 Tax=Sulfitobacter sediminis TaxID=3234186 RepID=A0ABV3RT95_9RHOB
MDQFITNFPNLNIEFIILCGVAIGSFFLILGAGTALSRPNVAAERLSNMNSRRQARLDQGILKPLEDDPTGLMKSFVPSDESVRSALRRKLEHAGMGGPNAVPKFMFVRVMLGIVLPALFFAAVLLSRNSPSLLPLGVGEKLAGLSQIGTYQWLTAMVAVGYFAPIHWLNGRAEERRRRVEEGFPNALDLMRVSVEAGLGFDAAMTRVANELSKVSPDIAMEFLAVQHEVQAGRGRDLAMQDMADRIGLDFVYSFVNVVRQSMQFGTSMTDALTVYAEELRASREMRAQEMANKLPVKMSIVLTTLMLPALLLIALGPVVIRYTQYFGN